MTNESNADDFNKYLREKLAPKMTDAQVELGRYALGLPNKKKISYRNHFCAGVGHSDYADWQSLVEQGLATRRCGTEISGGDDVFYLARIGAELCLLPGERLSPEDFRELSI